MDIFNKKKVEELNKEIERFKSSNMHLMNEISRCREREKDFNDRIARFEDISSQTMEENQKLIKWIMTILDTVGTMEVREKAQIKIPVYTEKTYNAYDVNYLGIYERERITIPEITIVRMG